MPPEQRENERERDRCKIYDGRKNTRAESLAVHPLVWPSSRGKIKGERHRGSSGPLCCGCLIVTQANLKGFNWGSDGCPYLLDVWMFYSQRLNAEKAPFTQSETDLIDLFIGFGFIGAVVKTLTTEIKKKSHQTKSGVIKLNFRDFRHV